MRTVLSYSSILLLAASGLRAQDAPAVLEPSSVAWQRFLAEHGPRWTAVWNKATGTPKAIFGEGLTVRPSGIDSLADARGIAQRVLDQHADLLGRGASVFVEDIAAETERVFVFVYAQRFRGLEVVGGRADVRVHEVGVVSMFGSQAIAIANDFGIVPGIEPEFATAVAHQHVKATSARVDAHLVIWADVDGPDAATPVLAWRIGIDDRSGERPIVGKVYVDSRTGKILDWVDEVYDCASGHVHVRGESADHERAEEHREGPAGPAFVDVSGNVMSWLNRGTSPVSALTNTPLQGIRVAIQGGGSAFTDANGNFTIANAGTAPVTLLVGFTTGAGQYCNAVNPLQGTPVSASVSATPGTPVSIQLLNAASPDFDWSQPTVFWHVDDVHRWIRSLTGPIPTNRINLAAVTATVNRASTCNAFYTGNTINFYAAGGTCNMTGYSSVVYHEWGHGCDDAFGGISQTDGLSEGWGDIHSIYRLDDPIIGRDFRTNGGIVRTALNTLTYPQTGASVHTQGSVWMGWAWQVREGLKASLGTAPGVARAEQIVVASIAANAVNQPDAVTEVFILDDNDGNLSNGTPNYAVLSAAAITRNLPYPQLQLATIAHTALPNTQDQLEPQTVEATVTPVSGSVTQVEIVYDAGAGTQRQRMASLGSNRYRGLLPGVLSPASVRYHLEALHSTNATVRYPGSGEISYAVGDEQQFFVDDFDGPNQGWTSGFITRQNDWQGGDPAGKFGSSSGVAWTDPQNAASGLNCRGTDLGLGADDGAYRSSSEMWLRSPILNLTGRTGVKLGFKRWLTVEEGIYDQATVRVNGAVVWQNPSSGHLVDTAWTDFEIVTPSADNNPSVQLEWCLRSDGGLQLGGWNVDDVRLFSFAAIPAPPLRLTLSPAQVPLGGTTTLSLRGLPGALGVLLVSDTQGPTNFPGIPTLHVGAAFVALAVGLDGAGALDASITVTSDPSAYGTLLYAHALQLNGSTFEASNKMVMLTGD